MEEYDDRVGDIIWIQLSGHDVRFECIVTEIDPEERRACRFKLVHDGPWGILGIIKEGDDWVVFEWDREIMKGRASQPPPSPN